MRQITAPLQPRTPQTAQSSIPLEFQKEAAQHNPLRTYADIVKGGKPDHTMEHGEQPMLNTEEAKKGWNPQIRLGVDPEKWTPQARDPRSPDDQPAVPTCTFGRISNARRQSVNVVITVFGCSIISTRQTMTKQRQSLMESARVRPFRDVFSVTRDRPRPNLFVYLAPPPT